MVSNVPKKSTKLDFESAIQELEQLVTQMESGETTLEESLKHFERGIELTRSCQQSLSAAEQKVEILMRNNDQAQFEPFNDKDTAQ